PFFGGHEGPVDEDIFPLESSTVVELGQERSPEVHPHILVHPLIQSTPTGRRAGVRIGKVAPSGARTKEPENPLERVAIRNPRPTTASLRRAGRQMWLYLRPLTIGEPNSAASAALCHPSLLRTA